VILLGDNKPLKWKKIASGFKVTIPKNLQKKPPCNYVWTLKVSELKENE